MIPKRFYITPILLFIVPVASAILVFPRYQEMRQLNKEISQLQTQSQDITKQVAELERTLEQLQDLKSSLGETVETALPSEVSFISLFAFFQNKSSENGVLLKNIDFAQLAGEIVKEAAKEPTKEPEPTKKTGEEPAGETPKETEELLALLETGFKLELTSSYSSLKTFLQTLEKSSRLIRVDSISISYGEEKGPLEEESLEGLKREFLNYEMLVSVYSYH